jgi:hypothetical protein
MVIDVAFWFEFMFDKTCYHVNANHFLLITAITISVATLIVQLGLLLSVMRTNARVCYCNLRSAMSLTFEDKTFLHPVLLTALDAAVHIWWIRR